MKLSRFQIGKKEFLFSNNMLHIGIDDTDSIHGGCTTWVATEIIKELSEFDLIGHPRLVRLNPNVPWKTRGNGAVSFTFGKGIGLSLIHISEPTRRYAIAYSGFWL